MKQERIRHSIETRELKLLLWEKCIHYGIVIFLFSLPVLVIYFQLKDYFEGVSIHKTQTQLWILIIPSIVGILFYRIQRNKLKLKIVETKLTREKIGQIVEKVGKELEWYPHIVDKNIIIAKTHPGFWSGSFGEQISILFDKDRVLINSICDLESKSSVVSMGRNKDNEDKLIEEIRNVSS